MKGLGGKRAVLLIAALLVMALVSGLTGIYLSTLVTEKRSVDDERMVLQAVNFADAGVSHAVTELRKRMGIDLRAKVLSQTKASYFNDYVTANASLAFLADNCYASDGEKFTVNGNEAVLGVAALNMTSGVEGNYTNTRIRITVPQAPTADLANETFRFYYAYSLDSTGTITRYSPAIEKEVLSAPQTFTIVIRRDNFAKFALFTSHHVTQSGTAVWFTSNTNFSGPVHTNERFCFEGNPSAHFTAEASQHLTKAYFYNGGWEKLLDAESNGTLDVPEFDEGFTRSADEISLTSSITQADMKNYALGGSTDPGTGIYVMNDGTKCTGGIYIRGNQGQSSDDATITMSVDGSDRQVYTINQGGSNVTVTIGATQTIVTDSSGTNTYTGKPDGTNHEGILIYVNDDIKSLSGTVQSSTLATIASERDIKITGNVKYASYTSSPLSAEGADNLLGILSWGGNVRITTSAPDNVEIHGVVMAPHGVFTVDNYNSGSARGTATLLGGVISEYYGAFGTFGGMFGDTGYGRKFVYDERMMEGMSPPYFPYMTNFCSVVEPTNALMQKLVWQAKEG